MISCIIRSEHFVEVNTLIIHFVIVSKLLWGFLEILRLLSFYLVLGKFNQKVFIPLVRILV